jgi:hypothetical protein
MPLRNKYAPLTSWITYLTHLYVKITSLTMVYKTKSQAPEVFIQTEYATADNIQD